MTKQEMHNLKVGDKIIFPDDFYNSGETFQITMLPFAKIYGKEFTGVRRKMFHVIGVTEPNAFWDISEHNMLKCKLYQPAHSIQDTEEQITIKHANIADMGKTKDNKEYDIIENLRIFLGD